MADIHRDDLEQLASNLTDNGGGAHTAYLDVSQAEEVLGFTRQKGGCHEANSNKITA